MKPDFCEYCNTPLGGSRKPVTVYRHRRRQRFIFERVRARVCLRCGERYFSPTILRKMDRCMQKGKQRVPTVEVPVIVFKPASG